jgi:hypothetical protein
MKCTPSTRSSIICSLVKEQTILGERMCSTRRFRKIYSGTNCTVLFVYCYTVYKILRLDNENNICVQRTCIMEFATSRTFSAVRNTPTSDKSKRTPSITIGSTLFFMCITSMLWLRCAGRRLNDSFRGIQLLEWFIQDHSDGWMIHSGPFSCLNDSFRLLNKNPTFTQKVARCWIASMYSFSTSYK